MANTFREYASDQSDIRKWVIFDGPIDTLWIESMNTVLDDNKKVIINGTILCEQQRQSVFVLDLRSSVAQLRQLQFSNSKHLVFNCFTAVS